ncbi:MAG: shikimate dehydrogenase [Microbacteriaceae bacterium]|nr:shikimate dehydrogenase [Microbacteriaceae bacterium]
MAHSLSPRLHQAAYKYLGLNFEYSAIEVDESAFAPFITSLDDSWRGFSVTMPLKKVAYDLAFERDELAKKLEVANTFYRVGNEVNASVAEANTTGNKATSIHWHASNTDIAGILGALRDIKFERVLLLGSGATAKNCVYALSILGAKNVVIAARNQVSAAEIASEFNSEKFSTKAVQLSNIPGSNNFDLVINTIPGNPEPFLNPVGALFEVIYNPWPTKLAALWSRAGHFVIPGIDMLIHQAVSQVAIFATENSEKWSQSLVPEITEIMARVVNRDFNLPWSKNF